MILAHVEVGRNTKTVVEEKNKKVKNSKLFAG